MMHVILALKRCKNNKEEWLNCNYYFSNKTLMDAIWLPKIYRECFAVTENEKEHLKQEYLAYQEQSTLGFDLDREYTVELVEFRD